MNEDVILKKSFSWDYRTWSRSLNLLNTDSSVRAMKVLELGGGENEGLSLYFASIGCDVTFSSVFEVSDKVKSNHKKWQFSNRINYRLIDALNIGAWQEYDLVCFKSMLGGISRDDSANTERVVKECSAALKPGGTLFFCENLSGSIFHKFARSLFSKAYRNKWHYYDSRELIAIIEKNFSKVDFICVGFFSLFAVGSRTSKIFSWLDKNFSDKVIPEKYRYVIAVRAIK